MSLKVSPQARAFLATSQSDPVQGPRWKAGIATFMEGRKLNIPVREKTITQLLEKVYSKYEQKNPLVQELRQWFLSKANPNPSEPSRLIKLFTKIKEGKFVAEKKEVKPAPAPMTVRIAPVLTGDQPRQDVLPVDPARQEKWEALASQFGVLGKAVQTQGSGQVQLQGKTAALEEEFRRFRGETAAHLQRSENLDRQNQVLQGQVGALSAQLQGVLAADQGDRVRIGNVEADLVRRAAATLADIQLAYDTAVSNRNTLDRERNRLLAEWSGLESRESALLGSSIGVMTGGSLAALTGSIGAPIASYAATFAGHTAHAAFYGVAGAATPAFFGLAIVALPLLAIGGVLCGIHAHEQKRIEEIQAELKKVKQALEGAEELVQRWDASRNNPVGAVQQQAAAPAPQPAAAPQPAPAPAAQPAAVPEAQPIRDPKPAPTPSMLLVDSDYEEI